jgi:uncharacterized Zn-binding protein involved in type VI secretion
MPPLAALGHMALVQADAHGCPACPHACTGPLIMGSPSFFVNGMPAGHVGPPCVGVHAACCGPNMWSVAVGSLTVFINGKPAARKDDVTQHCGGTGKITQGSLNVFADGP